MAVYWPNEDDRRKIQQMWDDYKRRSPTPPRGNSEPAPMQPNGSAQIVLLNKDCPALVRETVNGSFYNYPGKTTARALQLIDSGLPQLVTNLSVPFDVYNYTQEEISAHGFHLVVQTKYGRWAIVAPGGSSSGGESLTWEGVLAEPLTAPAYITDPATSAQVHLMRRTGTYGELELQYDTVGDPILFVVHNNDPWLSGDEGTYVQFTRTQPANNDFGDETYHIFTYVSCGNGLPPGTGTGTGIA